MPRKKRIWYPGASYHVMSRGNRRGAIFKDEEDYLIFLECLKQVKDLFVIKIHSICLMTNHFHMAVETGEKELWKTMQKLLLTYAVNYNQKTNTPSVLKMTAAADVSSPPAWKTSAPRVQSWPLWSFSMSRRRAWSSALPLKSPLISTTTRR